MASKRQSRSSASSRQGDEAMATRMFAMAVPGLGALLSDELTSLPGARVRDRGCDGRVDVVLFDAAPLTHPAVLGLELAEDVFVEIGRTLRSEGDNPRWIAGRIWRPARLQRALAIRSQLAGPIRNKATSRVIVRVLQEKSFLRTELRRHLTAVIQRDRLDWQVADPAQLEVWLAEYRKGRLVAGLRLSDARMRQGKGREVERHGALRPTVAAAMIRLAGKPRGTLLDPCCGSGAILAESARRGWHTLGSDIDPEAIAIARRNVPEVSVEVADVRRLTLADASVAACVSNLPFGRQHRVPGDMVTWLRSVLAEMARVTQSGGHVVLLAPDIPHSATPDALTLTERHPIRLLGAKTTIWRYSRQ